MDVVQAIHEHSATLSFRHAGVAERWVSIGSPHFLKVLVLFNYSIQDAFPFLGVWTGGQSSCRSYPLVEKWYSCPIFISSPHETHFIGACSFILRLCSFSFILFFPPKTKLFWVCLFHFCTGISTCSLSINLMMSCNIKFHSTNSAAHYIYVG